MPSPMPAPAPVTRTAWLLKSNMCVLSVDGEHGLARKPAGYQILRHLPDLLPRALQADMGRELTGGDELRETTQTDGRRLVAELGEEIEAVERRAAGDEEVARVEGNLGRG